MALRTRTQRRGKHTDWCVTRQCAHEWKKYLFSGTFHALAHPQQVNPSPGASDARLTTTPAVSVVSAVSARRCGKQHLAGSETFANLTTLRWSGSAPAYPSTLSPGRAHTVHSLLPSSSANAGEEMKSLRPPRRRGKAAGPHSTKADTTHSRTRPHGRVIRLPKGPAGPERGAGNASAARIRPTPPITPHTPDAH